MILCPSSLTTGAMSCDLYYSSFHVCMRSGIVLRYIEAVWSFVLPWFAALERIIIENFSHNMCIQMTCWCLDFLWIVPSVGGLCQCQCWRQNMHIVLENCVLFFKLQNLCSRELNNMLVCLSSLHLQVQGYCHTFLWLLAHVWMNLLNWENTYMCQSLWALYQEFRLNSRWGGVQWLENGNFHNPHQCVSQCINYCLP